MSDQQDEEILRRRAREQADIERQTDALVLRTLTALVTASEELKSKLRRDTESLLEGYRRSRRQLENEISLTTAERLRSRREAEQEKATIIAEAKAQAQQIVEAAKRERETMLGEARLMEQRLRALEDQIRSVFGAGLPELDVSIDPSPREAAGAIPPFVPGSPALPAPLAEPSAAAGPDEAAVDADRPSAEPEGTIGEELPPALPAAAPAQAPHTDSDRHAADDEHAEAPPTSVAPLPPPAPSTSHARPAAPPGPVASLTPSAPAPAPPARPVPFPVRAYTQQPAAAQRRPVELVFDGVPGYQQASALERAVNDLLPDEEIDILQFDRGQLVLGLQAADLVRLADQLVAGSPASLELEAVAGNRATFRCI